MGRRSRVLRERRQTVRPGIPTVSAPTIDSEALYLPPRPFCVANDVGRVAWVEILSSMAPAGDCDGLLWKVLHADAHVCERHLLQLIQTGRRSRRRW